MLNHGIYIHIPFCLKKCAYCDFYSLADLTLRQPFVDSLLQEMLMIKQHDVFTDTLYLGGGTPSILTTLQIEALMQQAQSQFSLARDTEITMEVNPGTVSQNQLAFLRQIGINRLNIGVQSFSPDILAFLGRIHTSQDAIQTIQSARDVGFDNIGLDLIFGIPGQTVSSWQTDLNTALSWSPEHLSCYMLTFEPGTLLEQQKKNKVFKTLPEQRLADLFRFTQQFLGNARYEQYEISNFARIESNGGSWRSRHNQKYWSFAPYTGLGPSAHSYLPPVRNWNVSDVREYITALTQNLLPIEGTEETTTEQQMTEAIYLGLRTADGIDMTQFELKFHRNIIQHYGDTLREVCEEELMILEGGRCALTPQGMLFHENIVSRLIEA
jgi:putative oxygen-independent coproporphyrinogen III oxidase